MSMKASMRRRERSEIPALPVNVVFCIRKRHNQESPLPSGKRRKKEEAGFSFLHVESAI